MANFVDILAEVMHLRLPVWKVLLLVVATAVVMGKFDDSKKKKNIKEEGETTTGHAAETTAGPDSKPNVTPAPAPASEEKSDSDDDVDDDYGNPDWLFYDGPYEIADDYTRGDRPFKMLLCVNMELKMGKGKIAAQCGHAALGAYQLSRKYCRSGVTQWEQHGVAKIAVKVETEAEMMELFEVAKAVGLAAFIVQDAGRTQIAAGSRTVLALGPAPARVIDPICSHLKLL